MTITVAVKVALMLVVAIVLAVVLVTTGSLIRAIGLAAAQA